MDKTTRVIHARADPSNAGTKHLAADTLASTRLALQAIGHTEPLTMKACPTSAFLLWAPQRLGAAREAVFGLGQLSFTLHLEGGALGFGTLFNATGIPLAEFSRFMPLRRRRGIDVLSWIISSCAAGNIFLSGEYTRVSLRLTPKDSLRVEGRFGEAAHRLMSEAQRKLCAAFLRLGAILLPGSFRMGQPGGDIMDQVRRLVARGEFTLLLALRIAPVVPGWLLNLAAALAHMRVRAFLITTTNGLLLQMLALSALTILPVIRRHMRRDPLS